MKTKPSRPPIADKWLTPPRAGLLLGVTDETIKGWHRFGLFPNAQSISRLKIPIGDVHLVQQISATLDPNLKGRARLQAIKDVIDARHRPPIQQKIVV